MNGNGKDTLLWNASPVQHDAGNLHSCFLLDIVIANLAIDRQILAQSPPPRRILHLCITTSNLFHHKFIAKFDSMENGRHSY